MKIDNIKDLKAVIKLCREQGVDIIKVDGIELVLGSKPLLQRNTTVSPQHTVDTYSLGNIDETVQIPLSNLDIPTDGPTDDQILFGSSDPSVWSDQQ